jgi:LysR family cys regulon transcriptional activator
LHQGTSEQIADLVAEGRVDFAIATDSQSLFPELNLLPCFHWDRIVLTRKDHALATSKQALSLQALAEHPLISYVFSSNRGSSFLRAFENEQLQPNVVFTARDADVIKTYVRMGLGVGIVASMAEDCDDRKDLVSLDAAGLFPRSTTWIGFRKESVLRRYMLDFVQLFAPHITPEQLEQTRHARTQDDIDALYGGSDLPLRGGCSDDFTEAA